MPRPKPNRLHDELDALLDGRPVELTDELAPLAEAADALRAELAAYQLDPQVADLHLERVLDGSAPVVRLPVRTQPHGWDVRRRLAAVVLAAALVLAPATMASAAALPGQAMYPLKRAIEELRIASVQWSPGREAGERTQVADERREEVVRLTDLKIFNQLPTAITALTKAIEEAQDAADDAREHGKLPLAVERQLTGVAAASSQAIRDVSAVAASAPFLPRGTLEAINAAVDQSQVVLPQDDPPVVGTPTPNTTATQPTAGPGSTTASNQTSTTLGQSSTTEATSTTEAATTTTTQAPTTTTAPPTESSVTPGSAGGADEGVPPTTVLGP
jgi:Domain of unknown function (DUF5667)